MGLFSGIVMALGNVAGRVGLRGSKPMEGVFWTLLPGIAIIVLATIILFLVGVPIPLDPRGLPYLIVAGFTSDLGARLAFFHAIARIGVSRTAQLRAVDPVITAGIAVTWLAEELTLASSLGIVMVTAGVAILALEKSVPGGEGNNALESRKSLLSREKTIGILFGLLASFLYVISNLTAKVGMAYVSPYAGTAIRHISGLIFLMLYLLFTRKTGEIRGVASQSIRYYTLSGALMTASVLLFFIGLVSAPVSTTNALKNTTPLWATLFGYIFIRQEERVTPQVLASAAIITAGVFLVVFKG